MSSLGGGKSTRTLVFFFYYWLLEEMLLSLELRSTFWVSMGDRPCVRNEPIGDMTKVSLSILYGPLAFFGQFFFLLLTSTSSVD